jgi:hypothetical protein
MTKFAADTYVTRQKATDRLKVSPRTIDRYAAEGALAKVKLGKRRSAFKPADLEAHIAKLNGGAILADQPVMKRQEYQSPGSGTIIEVPGIAAAEAEALQKLLTKLGFPGILPVLSRGHLILTWPDALGCTEDGIEKNIAKAIRKGERIS